MHYTSAMRIVSSPCHTRLRAAYGTPLRRAVACLAVALAGGACHDSPSDPLATLVTPETAPALEVETVLPTLPDLAARNGVEDRVSGPALAWMRSWDDPEGGAAARRQAVERAAPALAEALGPGGTSQALAPLFQVAHSLDAITDPPASLEAMLSDVAVGVARARRALDQGRPAEALREGLWAADRIRAASPEQVARALVSRGEEVLATAGEAPGGRAELDPDRQRGVLLLERARQALEAGDYPRAVQRAFYACQLLQAAPGS